MFSKSKMALRAFALIAMVAGSTYAVSSNAAEKTSDTTIFSEKELQTAAWLRDAARADNASYRILESLTTEVGPRLAGSPADARAVAWAEAKFKELGFDKVWKEPVSFPTWQRGIEKAEIIAPFPQPLLVTALGNSVATPADGLSAELVQFASLKELMSAAPDSVKGKIVFINHKMQNASEYGAVQAGRTKGASEAARKGAVAIIIRSVGTDSHRFPHTGVMNYDDGVSKIPAAAMSNSDADMVVRMLKRGKPVTVKLQLSSAAASTYTSYNVIGEITGSELPNEYVLIGGHLDSWDLGTGAIDDGAGCAITMAAAEFIKRHGLKPKRSIRVVLFANEEQGLFGGKAYAQAHEKQLAAIQAASEADSGQGPVTQMSSFVRPEAFGIVKQMHNVLAPLGIAAGGNNAYPGPDMGGLRALGVASFGLTLKTDDYFDLHHTPDDTFDKIEPARINQATAAYTVFAWMAANSPIGFGSGAEYLKAIKQ
ncbi:M20/M25/M40 family metallo-hydrolase [Undibacterium cyanobacteriorum]|uniref:Carboxypeptidase Q n=1 Tax=Undibacterium cyanobacteriorum TaxID=3073561 RepID=A0ABY9RE37_9BURK|nr:M20/M25/M40 family metallo-hydrolase [Undibacterium sp. 20NA77.5]WMW79487.1 M20/M25/M40 family metallo-hydrolase [Undibacterium sp. 20NA77.5]